MLFPVVFLEGFEHPAADRPFLWDLRRGREVVETQLGGVEDPARRALVREHVRRFDAHAGPLLGELRHGVIHGDANDHNVLVSLPPEDPCEPRRVVGLIDFGDVVRSWVVADPAIAAAYAMLGSVDPVGIVACLAQGSHDIHPLREAEVEALLPLATLRLCVSVVLSARNRRLRPDDAYVTISEAPAWEALGRLAACHPRLSRARVRDACGLDPLPVATRVIRWLETRGGEAGAVMEPDPRSARTLVFDLSVASPDPEEAPGVGAPAESWTAGLFGRMARDGAAVGVGRWNEARRWYTTDAYRVPTDEGGEWRTVHLGVDLFAPPGTPVRAPLDAVVHAVRDNDAAGDYGPTAILRHEVPEEGLVFFTLYGHLARASLAELTPGAPVARGQRIGRLGDAGENGGWAPHLHFQVVTDLLGHEGTFPGVARPSERSVWTSLCPDPDLLLRIPGLAPAPAPPETASLLAERSRTVGPSLSVSYRRPLHVVRGWMQRLYDVEGQPYLDGVNNVAHVGHAHPRVVEALRRQAAVLNTNTRYLHELLLEYARRLTATMPDPLRVCFFTCSGSEANELALRLARVHTGRRDVVVLDAAYHGNTTSLIGMSPYKFAGPGGSGRPPWVHVAALPDPYRGAHRGATGEAAAAYAEDVRARLRDASARGGAAAFFAETLPGCGGQIVPPRGYLARAFRHAREAGALCVADEVQVGFGRVGSHFWAFEAQDAVPDVVTLGKPMGNGHPLGAVVTTSEIAQSFANGMEYFNTFGGNPVSCAVGMAVLDVIEEEDLQARASRVGERLLAGLSELATRHPIVGDVRGAGLYLGVELVSDPETPTPAGRHAFWVVERMRDHGILLSTDGPDQNVVKNKPPMVFGDDDAERLVEVLDRVLQEDPARV
ncbi:MAG: aminotransferase class III-fold pyridoxal phosphate-dependent enzyme [Gemmatimonadetes bacterium]|nr:aminotransferase class III-fold pyridoxal phosphate-dependent enzyme [Gemmatimonadota bacterium]